MKNIFKKILKNKENIKNKLNEDVKIDSIII